jgi:hypothetical protein
VPVILRFQPSEPIRPPDKLAMSGMVAAPPSSGAAGSAGGAVSMQDAVGYSLRDLFLGVGQILAWMRNGDQGHFLRGTAD